MYVNKIENRVTSKIKNGYSLELLTPETMKLLGSTKNKINKDKNGENVSHLEITKMVLVHCDIVNNDYQHNSRVLYTFVPNKPFSNLLKVSPINHGNKIADKITSVLKKSSSNCKIIMIIIIIIIMKM